MKVVNVTTYIVDPGVSKNWFFVKIETDEGIYGWGEAYTQVNLEDSLRNHVEAIKGYLIGRDPFEIKSFVLSMHADFMARRPSLVFYAARSALEQALWDIVGKALNQPVHRLLGGAVRSRVRVYANGWYHGSKSLAEYGERARGIVARGFNALKFDPFPPPRRNQISRADENLAIARVQAVREAVGPDVDILIEVHRRLEPVAAIRIARRLEKLSVFWYEEPIDVEYLSSLAEVRRAIDIPVVTGETLYTKSQFVGVFAERAADIINPDVCCCGILEALDISAMADAHKVLVAPHNFNSGTVGLAAALQVAACIPNLLIVEYVGNFVEPSAAVIKNNFVIRDGYIDLPTAPGLGVDLHESELLARPQRKFPDRHFPTLYYDPIAAGHQHK